MTPTALLQQLRALGVIVTRCPDTSLRWRAPKGVLTPALLDAIREHKAALLTLLTPALLAQSAAANHPEPCQHLRYFARQDGSRLCVRCWQACAPGQTSWAPESPPARCPEGQHTFWPADPAMPGVVQCRHCPQVEAHP